MNKPLESTGDIRPLSRPATGRVLVVGAGRDSRRLARTLGNGPWTGLPIVGFVDAAHPRHSGSSGRRRQLAFHPRTNPVPVLGGIDRLGELVDRSKATHIVVALSGRPASRLKPRLARLGQREVAVHWVSQGGATTVDAPTDTPFGADHPSWTLRWSRFGKRLVDIVASGIGLLMLAPLFAGVSLAIMATTGRPIFYSQERVGQRGRTFRIIKFRSMRNDAEGATGPIWASGQDSRCTKIGTWLRKTNIDELPQLFNVFKGEMSLVGPRPERPIFVDQFRETVPDYDLRHAVPGGMTGWAQVHGWRGRTSLRKRVQYDLDYIQRWSFWLDFRVLLMTVQHVVWGKTSWNGGPKRRPES